jgi:hypothetical protein
MLIDAILDRKYERENGIFRYDPRELYNYINGLAGGLYDTVVSAMDEGSEADVKKALCFYIGAQGYNPDIKDFVNSVDWLTSDPKKPKQEIFQTIRAYKSREDMYALNPLDLKFVVNCNPDYRESYEKEYARGVAAGLTVKYASPVVAVLTTIDGKTEVTEVHQARRCK